MKPDLLARLPLQRQDMERSASKLWSIPKFSQNVTRDIQGAPRAIRVGHLPRKLARFDGRHQLPSVTTYQKAVRQTW